MRLFTSSLIYIITSLLNTALPFLLLPFLTKYLTPTEYGVLAIFQLFVAFLPPFMNFNINLSISKNFYNSDQNSIALLIGNSLFLIFLAYLIISLFFYALVLLHVSAGIPTLWFMLVPLISISAAINMAYLSILRNTDKPLNYGLLEIAKTTINVTLTFYLIVCLSYNWEGRAYATLLASMLFALISFYMLYKKKYVRFHINSASLKEILKFSIPMIPFSLGAFIINFSDRLFIEKMMNSSELGIYSVGYSFGMIIMLFSTSFIKAWSPWFFKTLSIDKNKLIIVKYTYFFGVLLLALAIFISVSAQWVIPFMTSKAYYGATAFVFWISMGYFMQGLYNMIYQYLVIVEKTHILGIITIIASIINLILNYYLIKLNGTVGAAQSTFISFTIIFVVLFIYSNRFYPMPWFSFKEIIKS